MTMETCCDCGAETGRAGRGDDSLYAGDYGPYCECCWDDLRASQADEIDRLRAENADLSRALIMERNADAMLHQSLTSLRADKAALVEALEQIAEEHDAGRHDGLPEPCPAHDDVLMWTIARAALAKEGGG
jgi:hypothetical protein